LTDIAGPTAMANGKGSVIAAEMAAEDFGAGLNVEVISADHSGKPDTGSQIAARWFDLEASTPSPTCRARRSVSRAESGGSEEQNHVAVGLDLVGLQRKACSPLTVQWTVDTYNLAMGRRRP